MTILAYLAGALYFMAFLFVWSYANALGLSAARSFLPALFWPITIVVGAGAIRGRQEKRQEEFHALLQKRFDDATKIIDDLNAEAAATTTAKHDQAKYN